ncbi:uncharacterized protein LOC127260803 [Andrographis paniculata]|uniref:uncharacterized protein LOC127260803 n=1 Tax=Andrographis paniculata TaxID=175694 RepID=UPI0021E73129|nr:uncharacterized protein LOC127260803 [Andrographis paniculata]
MKKIMMNFECDKIQCEPPGVGSIANTEPFIAGSTEGSERLGIGSIASSKSSRASSLENLKPPETGSVTQHPEPARADPVEGAEQLRGKSIGSSESSSEIASEVELPSPVHKTYPAFQAQDPLEDVDLSTDGVSRITKEYRDCFAWDYNEISGLARELVEHQLPIKFGYKPHKLPPRRYNPDVYAKIKEEIRRLLGAGFIRTCRYPEWMANVVPVLKKNSKLWVSVDYRNLNLAKPKDEYVMPITDMLVDAAGTNGSLSFIDGYSGYNQIFIAEEDVAKMAFRCPGALGVYEWVVIPLGLKNAGATYQRTMNTIFHDLIEQSVEVYIDDILVKSKSFSRHLLDLKQAFRRMRHYNLKMNTVKCAFGVGSGNFLGLMVHNKVIKVDSNKKRAIINARPPENLKQLQGFLGQVNVLRRFISNAAGKLKTFYALLKLRKTEEFVWKPPHQLAFEAIKEALANPPMRLPIEASVPFFYLSKVINDAETRPALRGRQAKWAVKLATFDLRYVSIKAVKGQVIANFLADHPSLISARVRVFIESPWGRKWTVARPLAPEFTNNQVEYEALLVGLRILHKKGAKKIKVQGDSQLILKQIAVEVEDWRMELRKYLEQPTDDTLEKPWKQALKCTLIDGDLFRRAAHGMLMKCVNTQEAMKVMGEDKAANKVLIEVIKKAVKDNSRRWHEVSGEALWAYRQYQNKATGCTPYQLVYGQEAILPLEITVPSLQVLNHNLLNPEEYDTTMLQKLDDVHEDRMMTLENIRVNKTKVA